MPPPCVENPVIRPSPAPKLVKSAPRRHSKQYPHDPLDAAQADSSSNITKEWYEVVDDLIKKPMDEFKNNQDVISVPKEVSVESWDLLGHLRSLIMANGGPVCCHAHFDKSYTISAATLGMANDSMEVKWDTWQNIKRKYTLDNLVLRIGRSVQNFVNQGCKAVRTFIDVDQTVGLLCIEAARIVKMKFADRIDVQLVSQVLEGALTPESQNWIERAAPLVDVIGGLPSRDRPHQAEHLDYIFGVAKRYNKPVDVHIDQNNDPDERDTELLARKVIEHGLQGRVNAIHACSLAAQPDDYLDQVCALIKQADMSVVICPRAMLDGVQLRHKMAPVHNSIGPVTHFLKHGINVALGVDNVHDYFCPFADGDMFTELMFLLETCRLYDFDALTRIATTNGQKMIDQCHDPNTPLSNVSINSSCSLNSSLSIT